MEVLAKDILRHEITDSVSDSLRYEAFSLNI